LTEPNPDYSGMTVNERLFAAGLIEDFDCAAKARDREAMISILSRVKVSNPERTADSIIRDPARYGY
jgi:hypothetical protein